MTHWVRITEEGQDSHTFCGIPLAIPVSISWTNSKEQVSCLTCISNMKEKPNRPSKFGPASEMHKLKYVSGSPAKETYCGLPWADGSPFCAVNNNDITCLACIANMKNRPVIGWVKNSYGTNPIAIGEAIKQYIKFEIARQIHEQKSGN